jgi:hypothetical protein
MLLGLYWWRETRVFRSADISLLPNAPEQRLNYIYQALAQFPSYFLFTALFALSVSAFFLWPLFLSSTSGRKRRMWPATVTAAALAAGLALAIASGLLGGLYCPLCDGNTWALSEMGQTLTLIQGHERKLSPAGENVLKWVPVLVSVFFVSTLRRKQFRRADVTLAMAAITLTIVGAVLLLWHDRYILPFAPVLIALMIQCAGIGRPRLALAWITLMAALCLVGTRDYLALNDAVWRGVRVLQSGGAAPQEIDAGYSINGWLQYAHPENAPRNAAGQAVVPLVTTRDRLRYVVSSRPLEDHAVRGEIPFSRWMGAEGTIYLLENLFAPTAQ